MAEGWTTQVAAAAGVAAATGAAQLGLGYGLGVVVWPDIATADNSVWLGSLGWATWIPASSTVFGAVLASRFSPRGGGPWRFALAASAAVGALLAVALIALPARAAVRADTYTPETIAAGYAVIGVLFGLILAYWAVVSRPVAANLTATAAWLWAMAVAAIVVELTLHRNSATYLTSWQFANVGAAPRYGTIYWPSSLLTLLAALIIGAIGALPAARRGDHGVGAAASGATGPLLVAASFFVLAPQLNGALGPLESAYLIAPYAVLTGLAGSATTVTLAQRSAARRQAAARKAERTRPATATGVAAVPEPASRRRLRPTETPDRSGSVSPRPPKATARVKTPPPDKTKTTQPTPRPAPQDTQPTATQQSGAPPTPARQAAGRQPPAAASPGAGGLGAGSSAASGPGTGSPHADRPVTGRPAAVQANTAKPSPVQAAADSDPLPPAVDPWALPPASDPWQSSAVDQDEPTPDPKPKRGAFGWMRRNREAEANQPADSTPSPAAPPTPMNPPPIAPAPVKPRSTTEPRPAKAVKIPADPAPDASTQRSTVAPPPATPTIVKINPPRSGDSTPSKPAPTKATPSKPAPAKRAPAKAAPPKQAPPPETPTPNNTAT